MIRKGDTLEPASWIEALDYTSSAIRKISSESGSASIGVIGSAKTTNEESYSLVKLARKVIGTPNVDGAARFYDASVVRGLLATTGIAASSLELSGVAQAGSMLIVGSNVMEQLAHVGSRIQDAAENGCKIVAADPRRSKLAPYASLYLQPLPGTDLAWIRALLKTLIDRKLYIDAAPEMTGFEELRGSLADVSMDAVSQASGVRASDIEEAAEMLSGNRPSVVMFGLGVMQQANSTQVIRALADAALLLGAQTVPLRGQNNAQGASDLGLANDLLPGYAMLTDPEARKKWESVWDCALPSEPGMSAVQMLQGCKSGKIRALMVFGENVALSAPSSEAALEALDTVGFLAVSDLYLTETARLADVVFPACSFLEKDGTFTNLERRVQRVRKVMEPLGQSRSDLDIIADLAAALGKELSRYPAAVMMEIASSVAQYRSVSYDQLDQDWAQPWPLDAARAVLAAIPAAAVPATDPDYPFRLIASRINFHQQTGTVAARTPVLSREYPETFAEICEADAEKLRLRPGTTVTISSRTGSVKRRLTLTDAVPPGCVHVPHFFGGDSPNLLAPFDCDPASGVPVYKGHPVRIEAAK